MKERECTNYNNNVIKNNNILYLFGASDDVGLISDR